MTDRSDAPASSFDVLVVGSGVAGLFAALVLSRHPGLRVGVLTKGLISDSATKWAQGGVAVVLPGDEDSTDLHMSDTLAAGAGLCDLDAVRILVEEGPARILQLMTVGASFDRAPSGVYSRAREGGHSKARVLHSGGAATGAEVERALVEAVLASDAEVLERHASVDLLVENGACGGVIAWAPLPSGGGLVRREVRASAVVLATGGAGQLYSVTTNPAEATGDGVAMALRAGVPVADLEFFQFHPTALYHPGIPRPLLSEALRGHGAVLRDRDGDRFVNELLPRDQVSRAMATRMLEEGSDHLFLDASSLDGFEYRFPTIYEALVEADLDPGVDWLPVAPAAHHISGGIMTDLDGASALPGLYAAGEVACTGVHGANRLASNSLLEGLVFGMRTAEAIVRGGEHHLPTGVMRTLPDPGGRGARARVAAQLRGAVRPGRSEGAGAARHGKGGGPGMSSGRDPDLFRAGDDRIGCVYIEELEDRMPEVRYLADWEPLPSSGEQNGPARPLHGSGGLGGTRGSLGLPGSGRSGREAGSEPEAAGQLDTGKARAALQQAMTVNAGVLRSASSLERVAGILSDLRDGPAGRPASPFDAVELHNLVTIGSALVRSAYVRTETRGAHARSEHPDPDVAQRIRIVHGS